MVFQQVDGFNAILFYTVTIFNASGTTLDSHLSTIIVGLLLVVAFTIAAFFIDLMGRRFLLMTSGALMTLSLASLGIFFYVKQFHEAAVVSIQWLPLTALLVYITGYGTGVGSLPWLIMTEIIPNPVIGKSLDLLLEVEIDIVTKTLLSN